MMMMKKILIWLINIFNIKLKNIRKIIIELFSFILYIFIFFYNFNKYDILFKINKYIMVAKINLIYI
jgi:hypothetical protein